MVILKRYLSSNPKIKIRAPENLPQETFRIETRDEPEKSKRKMCPKTLKRVSFLPYLEVNVQKLTELETHWVEHRTKTNTTNFLEYCSRTNIKFALKKGKKMKANCPFYVSKP